MGLAREPRKRGSRFRKYGPFIREMKINMRFYRKSLVGMIGLGIVVFFATVALVADLISPYPYDELDLGRKFVPPNWSHPFGTDAIGMDVFSRVIHATRIDLMLGVIIIAIGGTIGTIVGLLAGYFGGPMDRALMRLTDLFFAFPTLVLAMAITAALRPSVQNLMIAASIAIWPSYARIVRGSTLAERQKEYVESAIASGMSHKRIMLREIFPNIVSVVIIYSALEMAAAILIAASLSFLGLGAQAPTPEWGSMASKGRPYLSSAWWISTFPGLAIFALVLGFILIGDALRDVLDPRLRL